MVDTLNASQFGRWPAGVLYDGLSEGEKPGRWFERAGEILLEIKSGDGPPPDPLLPDPVTLLNDMTMELRAQFDAFRAMRAEADRDLANHCDELAGKLARADIKAAVDAMSQIVRTLEKIDGLQRTIANDRARIAEASFDKDGYDRAREQLLDQLNRRAEAMSDERLRARCAELGLACPPVTTAEPQAPPGDEELRGEDVEGHRENSNNP